MHERESPLSLVGMTGRNLYRQPVRTSLTALGVAIGVVAIVAFGASAKGLWQATQACLQAEGTDFTVFQAGVAADVLSRLDEKQTKERLLADPDVASVSGGLYHLYPMERQPFVITMGVRGHSFGFAEDRIIEGKMFNAPDEMVIGRQTQRSIEKSVGDTTVLNGMTFKITGIFETGIVFIDGAVVVPLETLQKLVNCPGEITNLQVKLRPGAEPKTVAARIESQYPELATITDVSEYNKIDQGLEIMDAMVWVVSMLALIIGCVIVTNTMWMSVNQRTREIGVLRAVGWSRANIVWMIVIEASGIGLIACIVGCLSGIGLAELVTKMQTVKQFVDPVFEASTFLLALAVAVILSVLGAMIPAYRASRISPAEALRYE